MTTPNNQPPSPAPAFAVTGGGSGTDTPADLAGRTQAAITALLAQQQIAQSPGWNASTASVWAGLRRGTAGNPVPLWLAQFEKFLNQLTGNNKTYNDMTALWSDTASFFSGNWGSLTAIGTDLSNTWNDFWNGVFGTSATGKTASDMQTAAASVSSTANTASTNASNALSQWLSALTAAGQSSATAFGNYVTNTWAQLTGTWNSFWNGTYGTSVTGKTAADVQTAAASTASSANTAATNAATAVSTANTASTSASSALTSIGNMLSAAGQSTATAFGTFLSTVNTLANNTLDAIWQGLTGGTTTGNTPSTVKTAAAGTASTANTASTNASSALTNAASAQSTANTGVSNAATAQSAANTAGTNASSALTSLSNMLTAAGQATATAFGTFLSSVNTLANSTLDNLWQAFTGGTTTGHSTSDVKTAASGVTSTANTASTNASSALTNAASAQSTANTGVSNAATAQSAANTAGTNASSALTSLSNMLTAASQATATAFGNFLSTTATNLQTGWDSLWQGLTGGSTTGNTPATVKTAAAGTSSTANTASTNASTAITNAAAAATSASTASTQALGVQNGISQAIAGGSPGGANPAVVTNLSAIPSANIAMTPNPSATGAPAHGATGTGWTPTQLGGFAALTLSTSGSHTIAAGDNYVVVPILYITEQTNSSAPAPYLTRTVNYGSQAMSSLTGPIQVGGYTTAGDWFYAYIEWFGLANPAAGAQTVTATVSNIPGWSFYIQCVAAFSDSYSGVQSVGTVMTNAGSVASGGTITSGSIASAAQNLVVQAFGVLVNNGVTMTLGSYSHTQRNNTGYLASGGILQSGDVAGASTVTFTAVETGAGGSSAYASAAINLIGAGTAPIGSGFRRYRASTTAANLAVGLSTLPASFFDTADKITADYTYNSSTNTLTVLNAGWYGFTVALTEGTPTTVHLLRAALYRNGVVARQGDSCYVSTTLTNAWAAQVSGRIYCAAGDTLTPGAYSSYTLGPLAYLIGESTGSMTYFEVDIDNRSLL